jgi:GT2 family glycosyltransferase
MALIGMAVFDPPGYPRTALTARTLASLRQTVNFQTHSLIVSDNGTVPETRDLYGTYADIIRAVIYNDHNLGTARAINRAWQLRTAGEHAVKMDNDVVIERAGWLDDLEACVARDPTIGIIGLKRNDCAEVPWAEAASWAHSDLKMLPHQPGERWLIVEVVNHVMGTCQLYSSALLDEIGFLAQPGLYGFDDALAAARCKTAGFYSCFWPHVTIHHIDPGDTPYQQSKEDYAGARMQTYFRLLRDFSSGRRSVYCGPDEVLA